MEHEPNVFFHCDDLVVSLIALHQGIHFDLQPAGPDCRQHVEMMKAGGVKIILQGQLKSALLKVPSLY